MKPARILIVEDKSIIAEALAHTLENAGYSITGKAVSGEEALILAESDVPDLVLMDIHLSGKLDGIQTAERLNKKINIPIIYLTDFHDAETVQRAKHTHPANYLLKPYQEKDLLIAIEIAFFNACTGKEFQMNVSEKEKKEFFPFKDRFFVKEKDILYRINIADTLWIEANGSYCKIKTLDRIYTLSISLGAFAERFDHILFLRVSRYYIVNMDKVTAIKGNMLIIDKEEEEIIIGEDYRDEVKKRLFRV